MRASVIAGVMCIVVSTACRSAGPSTALKVRERALADPLSRARAANTAVDRIVLHFSSDVLANPSDPYGLDRILAIYCDAGVSAHYLIDRDGTVYQLVSEDRAAFHARAWNDRSIGIEMLAIGSSTDMSRYLTAEEYSRIPKCHLGYTAAQYRVLRRLIGDIRRRHPEILHDREHIVGHEDIDPQRKSDPGTLFDWSRIELPRRGSPRSARNDFNVAVAALRLRPYA